MRLLKFMGKALVFPVMLIVTVIQWLFTFLVGLSSVIFNLLAGLFMLIAVLSIVFGISTWTEALRPALAAFIVFMIPVIGQGITAVIVVIREGLSDFDELEITELWRKSIKSFGNVQTLTAEMNSLSRFILRAA